LSSSNTGVPEGARILYRMGVNLSAVLIHGEDILADGVNIDAAGRRSWRYRSHRYRADPRLRTRPDEEENAARIGCEKQRRVSAPANRAILGSLAKWGNQ
jgi:hypothetical protein